MADRSVSVPMTLSDLDRSDASNHFSCGSNNADSVKPNYCICRNASRGLSATADEFLVILVFIGSDEIIFISRNILILVHIKQLSVSVCLYQFCFARLFLHKSVTLAPGP